MFRIAGAVLALLFLSVFVCHAASAQGFPQQPQASGISIVGAWSWQSQGQGGMDNNTVSFQNDGSYVRVSQLVNGTLLRYWGQYRASQTGPAQVQLQTQTQGWLPQQICAQAPCFPMRCSQPPRPTEMNFALNFTSPSTIMVQGVMLSRDPSPYLLQQNVPERVVSGVAAPIVPNIPGGGGGYSGGGSSHPATNIPGLGGNCDDLQQQRICSINNGHIITSGGCMKCISP